MLPLVWVGLSTSWKRLLSNTKSQNAFEKVEAPDKVSRSISGRLKSPTI